MTTNQPVTGGGIYDYFQDQLADLQRDAYDEAWTDVGIPIQTAMKESFAMLLDVDAYFCGALSHTYTGKCPQGVSADVTSKTVTKAPKASAVASKRAALPAVGGPVGRVAALVDSRLAAAQADLARRERVRNAWMVAGVAAAAAGAYVVSQMPRRRSSRR